MVSSSTRSHSTRYVAFFRAAVLAYGQTVISVKTPRPNDNNQHMHLESSCRLSTKRQTTRLERAIVSQSNSLDIYLLMVATTRSKRIRMEKEVACLPQPTLVSTLPLLVESGFVGAAELGLLCQISRELWRETRSDDLWRSLCLQLWPCTEFLPRNFAAARGGHVWLYKQWIQGPLNRHPNLNPMPAPTYTASQIQFFVNVTYKGKPCMSECLCPEGLEILLKSGGVALTLNRPSILCKAEWSELKHEKEPYLKGELPQGLSTRAKGLDLFDFRVRMHVRTGLAICSVFEQLEYSDCTSCVNIHPIIKAGEELSKKCEFDLNKPQSPCLVNFDYWDEQEEREGLALKHTAEAAEIKSRFPDRVGFEFDLVLGIVNGGHYAITRCEIHSVKVNNEGDPQVFVSSKEEQVHGVTLLHILSELQETNVRLEEFKP